MTYYSEILADSPVFAWKLYDATPTGQNAVDYGPNSLYGTYVGTNGTHIKPLQAGHIATDSNSKSVLFSDDSGSDNVPSSTTGAKGYVKYNSYNSQFGAHIANAFTVELWVKFNAAVGYKQVSVSQALASRRKTAPLQWQLSCNAAPSITCWEAAGYAGSQASFGSYATATEASFESTFNGLDYEPPPQLKNNETGLVDVYDGNPHQLVGVKNAGFLRLYMDGVGAPQYWASGVSALPTNTTDYIYFNTASDTQGGGHICYMSNCSYFNAGLSASRIFAHYQAAVGFVTFLNAQWAFTAAKGLTLNAATNMGSGFEQLRSVPLVLSASAQVASSIAQKQRLGVVFQDAVSIGSSITTSSVLQMLLANAINVNAALGLNTIQQYALESTVMAGVVLQAGDETYNGWIINPFLGASVAAEGFGFQSFAGFRGQYYAAKDDGIYRLGGDTDAGSPILSYISMPKSNFGTAKLKRIHHAYIGAATDGTMVLRVIAKGRPYDYAVRNPSSDMAEQRVDVGRGISGNYWQFEMLNPDGQDFSLDSIKFLPIILERRI